MKNALFIRQGFNSSSSQIIKAVSKHKGLFYFQSAFFIIAGTLAIVLPHATAVGIELLIAALILSGGLIQGIATIRSHNHWWSLLSSAAAIVLGTVMLLNPIAGAIALATILAIFLVIEGITEIFLAIKLRPAVNWALLFTSGIIALILAVLVFIGWPSTTLAFLGIIVDVNFILYGVSTLAMTASVN